MCLRRKVSPFPRCFSSLSVVMMKPNHRFHRSRNPPPPPLFPRRRSRVPRPHPPAVSPPFLHHPHHLRPIPTRLPKSIPTSIPTNILRPPPIPPTAQTAPHLLRRRGQILPVRPLLPRRRREERQAARVYAGGFGDGVGFVGSGC